MLFISILAGIRKCSAIGVPGFGTIYKFLTEDAQEETRQNGMKAVNPKYIFRKLSCTVGD